MQISSYQRLQVIFFISILWGNVFSQVSYEVAEGDSEASYVQKYQADQAQRWSELLQANTFLQGEKLEYDITYGFITAGFICISITKIVVMTRSCQNQRGNAVKAI